MLHLHFSNRFEHLSALVVQRLGGPRDDPFQRDTVVVPSAAVQRHLTLAMAQAHGICTQVDFQWLAPWLWSQAQALLPGLPERGPLDGDALAWRVWQAFGDRAFVERHPRLRHYLQADTDAVMRLQLAERTADLLSQYATYRAEWVAGWLAGSAPALKPPHPDEAWQAELVARLVEDGKRQDLTPSNAPRTLADAVAALARLPDDELARRTLAAGLPLQVQLVALPAMPPLHLALLQQLARVAQVHVLTLNPCAEHWFEVVDARRLAWLAARGRADAHEVGHPLLAAWGRQAQSQLGLLVDAMGDGVVDDADFEPPDGDHLLAQLQAGILAMDPPPAGSVALAPGDRSLEVHVCHGLTRELEVLHDRLLSLLAADATLALSDIVVLTPALEDATPLIDAVFGTAPPGRFIPFTVTGRTLASVNAPARALVDLLALVDSRLPVSALAALLAQPVVARRFGLDHGGLDGGLERVQQWLRDAGVHWGLDAAQQARAGLPHTGRHTLADGLDRLFLGHVLPDDVSEPFAGLLPAGGAEGSAALDLGALWRVAQALQTLQAAVALPLPPARWTALLAETLAAWVTPADDDLDALRELRNAVQTLARRWQDAGLTEPLPLDVVRTALGELLDDAVRGGVPTGAVTFSALPSLRALPYRVVAIVGLDDGAFPANPRTAEFDLMAAQSRKGDRQRRDDDRNLFLDLLLSARKVLHLSHSGRSARDNSHRPPSVLVSELLDHLDSIVAGGARAQIVVEHPLQAFGEAAFRTDGDPRLRSHRAELAEALRAAVRARAQAADDTLPADNGGTSPDDEGDADAEAEADRAADSASPQPPFFAAPLPPPEAEWRQVTLAQWLDFFTHPQRFLLRQRLGLLLPQADDELQDDEPFVPDGLSRHALAAQLLPPLLDGLPLAQVAALARAGTQLPAGPFGQALLDSELAALDQHAQRVRQATLEPPLPPLDVSFSTTLDGVVWRLDAALADVRPEGLLLHRWGALRATDRLRAWIHHLLLCLAAPPGVWLDTTWLARGEHQRLRAIDSPEQAATHLDTLMRLYARGLREPLPLYPRSAWAYLQGADSRAAALGAWQNQSGIGPPGEGDDAHVCLALRGRPSPLAEGAITDFHDVAHAVFDPLIAHLVDDDEDGA